MNPEDHEDHEEGAGIVAYLRLRILREMIARLRRAEEGPDGATAEPGPPVGVFAVD